MRFGKRSNGWAAAGRRLFGESEAGASVDLTREDAVGGMDSPVSEEDDMPLAAEEPLIAGDPTQRLLTALGRFQRQVASAETGNARDGWADESMHQLINAIEIAIGENWDDIREALTDTARILQTYEDAGQVRKCLPFLQDSYEILCLMVGDLIVGNVRSGVLQKWRERYELALAMVLRDGLSLVEDDVDSGASEEDAYADATYPDQDAYDVALDQPAAAVVEAQSGEAVEAEDEDYYTSVARDPLPGLAQESAPFDEPDGFENSPFESAPLPSLDDVIRAGDRQEVADLAGDSTAAFEPLSPMPLPDDTYDVGLDTFDRAFHEADAEEAAAEVESGTHADVTYEDEDEEEGFILEPLADERARATAQEQPAEVEEPAEAFADAPVEDVPAPEALAPVPVIDAEYLDEPHVGLIGETADDAGAEDASADEVLEADDAPEADINEHTVEVDFEEEDLPEMADIVAPVEESAPEAAVPAPAPVSHATPEPEPEPAPGTSEALLRTAQVAMRAGNVGDAKRLALQLAANMAKLEADQVQEEVEGLEACLLEDSHRIAESEAAVAECEKTLQDRQWHIGEREGSIQEKHGQLGGLRENLTGIEHGIADLDEQIRLLQEKRDEAARHAAAVQQDIAQAETEEAHLQEDLNTLLEEKARAEQSLDTARQQVAQFLSIQRTHETEVAEAREELLRRMVAVEEIEKTIPASAKAPAPAPDGDALLF